MNTLNKFKIGILIFLFCCNAHLMQGQESELTIVKSDSLYIESPTLFECNIQFPDHYNQEKSYPLVISLHGGGGSYKEFKNIWKYFEDPQFIMATPQAPYKWLMDDRIGYDWLAWPSGNLELMASALKITSDYIKNLIYSLTRSYNIKEMYIMGFSQGSIITMVAGINNHDLINGMIILSGPTMYSLAWSPWSDSFELEWPSEESVRSAHHVRIFLAHGKSDPLIDIGRAHESVDLLKNFDYEVTLFEFEGGHEINEEALKGIEKWIKEEK